MKIRLDIRFQIQFYNHLGNSIRNSGNAEFALLSVSFRYGYCPYRRGKQQKRTTLEPTSKHKSHASVSL